MSPFLFTKHMFRHNLINGLKVTKLIPNHKPIAIRFLFTEQSLGISGYLQTRDRISAQFGQSRETLISRMEEFTNSESKIMITEFDLKNIIYLTEGSEPEISLLSKTIKKFHRQNQSFGTLSLGPTVMRLFHHLSEWDSALKLFKEPELKGFFSQTKSVVILMDLLFINGRYKECLEVMNSLQKENRFEKIHPNDCLLLSMASAYKINTAIAFDYALDLMRKASDAGAVISRKTVCLFAALSLNQGQASTALEVSSLTTQTNYITVRNLRLMALTELERFEDLFTELRLILKGVVVKDPEVLEETLKKIKEMLESKDDKRLHTEFSQIERSLTEGEHIQRTDSLDRLLLTPGVLFDDNSLMSRKFSFQPVPSVQSPSSAQPLLYDTQGLEASLKRAKQSGGQTTDLIKKLLIVYTKKYDHLNRGNPQNEAILNRIKQINDDLKKAIIQSNRLKYDFLNAFLMEFFTASGDLELALEAKNRISPNFRLFSFQMFNLATLLVKNGRTEAAINLIEGQLIGLNRSAESFREDREDFRELRDKSINRLLNALIDKQTETEIIRKVFEMFVRISPTKVNNTVLGPLIKMHLVKGDLSAALKEYTDCFVNYGEIPWNFKLMRVFIDAKDEKSLQTVVQTASQVFGPHNTRLDLSAAYLFCGLEGEAKREMSKINRVHQKAVEMVCKKFVKEERFDCFQSFVLMTETIGGIDRHKLFSLLSDAYKRSGQMSKAKEVMDLMRQPISGHKEDIL